MKLLCTILVVAAVFSCNSNSSESKTDNAKPISDTSVALKEDNSIKFDNYCNDRYGYCIDYPKEILYPQPESTNNDGRVFKNKHGDEVLRVFGRPNANPEGGYFTLEQQFDDDIHGVNEENGNNDRVISYQKLSKSFFVISGFKKGKIFYQKTILKEDGFCYAILQYDESEKTIFDKVSERIFKSFK